jgi:hypothetical protein
MDRTPSRSAGYQDIQDEKATGAMPVQSVARDHAPSSLFSPLDFRAAHEHATHSLLIMEQIETRIVRMIDDHLTQIRADVPGTYPSISIVLATARNFRQQLFTLRSLTTSLQHNLAKGGAL